MNTQNTPEAWAIGSAGEEGADSARALPDLGPANDRRRDAVVAAGEWIDANRHLIASAPSLLSFVETVDTWLVSPELTPEIVETMRALAGRLLEQVRVGDAQREFNRSNTL